MRLLSLPFTAAALLWAAGPAAAEETLEERVKRLEQKMEVKDDGGSPGSGETAGDATNVEVFYDDGLRFKGGDDFEGSVGAWAIFHGLFFIKENERNAVDSFTIREAGIRLYGRLWEAWEALVEIHAGPAGTTLWYGWAEFNKWEALRIRAGLFKEPYSLEVQEEVRWQDFPENSLTSRHAPGRDIGLMIHGSVIDGILNYWVGVFNGNGVATNADENSDKDISARVVIRPGATMDSDFLKHLYIGGGVTHGRMGKDFDETPFQFEVPSTQRTFHESGTSTNAFKVDDDVTRADVELAWCWGPIEFKNEWSYYRAKIEWPDEVDTWNSYSNYCTLGFWVGGSRTPGKRPQVKKALFDGGMGAFHFAVRYSKLYLGGEFQDRAGFGGTNHVREYAAVVNWYPNEHVRLSLMYAAVEYGHERVLAGTGLIDDEDVLIFRAQVDF